MGWDGMGEHAELKKEMRILWSENLKEVKKFGDRRKNEEEGELY